MKNRLLPLFVVLGSFSAYSQVGVGTKNPHGSAQLDVVAVSTENTSVKGMLIPRVSLESLTDATTITNGNVNSLLVFNDGGKGLKVPGYYYWYVDKWYRLATDGDSGSGKDGKDGSVGLAEGNGAPAPIGDPSYLGPNINIYTDLIAGDVYVQNVDGTWTRINGRNGKDGKDGKDGIVGTASSNFV